VGNNPINYVDPTGHEADEPSYDSVRSLGGIDTYEDYLEDWQCERHDKCSREGTEYANSRFVGAVLGMDDVLEISAGSGWGLATSIVSTDAADAATAAAADAFAQGLGRKASSAAAKRAAARTILGKIVQGSGKVSLGAVLVDLVKYEALYAEGYDKCMERERASKASNEGANAAPSTEQSQ
jgi:hypothetical protein